MRILTVLSSISEYLTSPGPCLVACIALIVAAYVAKHVVENASYVRIKARNFEGEFGRKAGPKLPKPKLTDASPGDLHREPAKRR